MKISENIELIDGTIANCYSVNLEGKAVLIDAGMKGSGRKIIDFYRNIGVSPELILITHYHPDHVGGLFILSEEFHPQIYVPDSEAEVIAGHSKIISAKSLRSKLIGSIARTKPVTDVNPVSKLSLQGLQVVDTKGHTPGSTSYYFPSLKALFVGDAVSVKNGKMEINKAFTLDYPTAEKSRDRILQFHGVTVYPGHGKHVVIS